MGLITSISLLLISSGAIAAPLSVTTGLKQSQPQNTPQTGSGSTTQTGPGSTTSVPPTSENTRFSCQFVNGKYTVMYYPQSQPNQAYPWAVPAEMGGGWSPERRCYEISRRLESYRPDGLQELRTGTENGYNIVCATTQQNSACRIVFTVPPGQDPTVTRDRVFENLTVADSGTQTEGVNTLRGNGDSGILNQIGQVLHVDLSSLGGNGRSASASRGINLRPFLDQADGGTGARLTGGFSTQSNPARLDPNRFR
jgi:hypothetical protein